MTALEAVDAALFKEGLFKLPLCRILYMCDNTMTGFGDVNDIQTIALTASKFIERHPTKFVLLYEGSVVFREIV
jgi:predicted small secreted protein